MSEEKKLERVTLPALKHTNLAEMATKVLGSASTLPVVPTDIKTNHEDIVAHAKEPGASKVEASSVVPAQEERGRHYIFKPTNERVTVTKEFVGRSYEGLGIHEVVTRSGKIFLASSKQLRPIV